MKLPNKKKKEKTKQKQSKIAELSDTSNPKESVQSWIIQSVEEKEHKEL